MAGEEGGGASRGRGGSQDPYRDGGRGGGRSGTRGGSEGSGAGRDRDVRNDGRYNPGGGGGNGNGNGGGNGGGGEPSNPAYRVIVNWLREWGLEGLASWAWQRYKDLGASSNAIEIIKFELPDRKEFKDRFPAYEALQKQGHAWTAAQIIDYEQQVGDQLNRIGADRLYSNQDRQQWLIKGVSAAEVGSRVQMASDAAQQSGQVAAELKRLYGVGGDLLAQFWLDPDRAQSRIEQMWRTGQIGAEAQVSGFGELSTAEAEMVAGRLDPGQANQAFGGLVANEDLFAQQAGDLAGVGRDQQLAAVTGDARAQEYIARRQRSRRAQFEGSGGFAAGQRGVVGLGSTPGS